MRRWRCSTSNRGGPTPHFGIDCDVADDASVRAAVEGVVDAVRPARRGGQQRRHRRPGHVADNADDEWHRVLDINVLGMVRVSRAALPHLRRSPAAAIVNTCSIAATAGLPQRALYSAQGRGARR